MKKAGALAPAYLGAEIVSVINKQLKATWCVSETKVLVNTLEDITELPPSVLKGSKTSDSGKMPRKEHWVLV